MGDASVRFDDMLATVLARRPERAGARNTLWRQVVDLLAQRRGGDADLTAAALARIEDLRAEVPLSIRREAAAAIAGRPLPLSVVALLAADAPPVAGAVLAAVSLDEGDWIALLPRLSPTGRAHLRHRRDLGPAVVAALGSFGASDFVVAGTVAATDAIVPEVSPIPAERETPFEEDGAEGQIRAIISRIASFRSARADAGPAPAAAIEGFRFETGTDGIIRWVDGAPRGPLIGETIARPAHGAFGVDAQAPGAFRRRASFRDARLCVAGDGPAGGDWRIAGVPVFADADGRFMGYRGTARRPRADERAEPASTGNAAADADTLRQLVHELRTPLNAIGGFAEMIRRQMRGPVSEAYRDRADTIAGEAGRLLVAVDDLDMSARLDGARLDRHDGPIDLARLVAAVAAEQDEAVRARSAAFAFEVDDAAPAAFADGALVRRIAGRLTAAAIALAEREEQVRLSLAVDGAIAVSRPHRLAGVAEAQLLDPGYGADGAWPDAPLLGLGFTLHLVRRLALAAGATLAIEAEAFVLRLPAAAPIAETLSG